MLTLVLIMIIIMSSLRYIAIHINVTCICIRRIEKERVVKHSRCFIKQNSEN